MFDATSELIVSKPSAGGQSTKIKSKLLDYSRFFTKKNTSLLFLKGRSVMKEIHEAKKSFSFEYDLYPSQSEGDGYVLKINKYKKL